MPALPSTRRRADDSPRGEDVLSPICRDPLKLCPCVLGRYRELKMKLVAPTTLVETLRQPDRQAYYYQIGATRTLTNSKHLPQNPNGLSLAFDIVPTEYLSARLWDPDGDLWSEMGRIGEALGLQWGGRWKSIHDNPHFQLPVCQC
jgi:hypothetical protein